MNATVTSTGARGAGTIENLEAAGVTRLEINQRALTMSHNAALDEDSVPAGSAFTVTVNGSGVALAASPVSISDRTVTVTLAAAVGRDDSVTVSYTAPSENPIQSSAGVGAPSFSTRTVRNTTSYGTNDFVTKWRTTAANESITIPTGGSSASYTVDWGDRHRENEPQRGRDTQLHARRELRGTDLQWAESVPVRREHDELGEAQNDRTVGHRSVDQHGGGLSECGEHDLRSAGHAGPV